ncbi:hypothetical protein KIPB_013850, partial [Kipferlia bialata]
QEEEELQECTFKPNIIQRPRSAARATTTNRKQLPLEDRLFHESDKRSARRQRLKTEVERETLQECSFRPRINRKSASLTHGRRPVPERVAELQREKERNLRRLRQTQDAASDHTFMPSIGEQSREIADRNRPQGVDATERLSSEHRRRERKRQELEQRVRSEEAREYTFAPQLNATSESLAATSGMFHGALSDFLV